MKYLDDQDEARGSKHHSIKSYFPLKGDMTCRTAVDKYLTEASVDEGYRADEFTKIWVFYVISAFLFPTTNQYVHAKWVEYADRYESLSEHNWPGAIYINLNRGLSGAQKALKEKSGKTSNNAY